MIRRPLGGGASDRARASLAIAVFAAIALVAMPSRAAQAQRPDSATVKVQGTVIDRLTRAPLAHARVQLASRDRSGIILNAVTNDSGRFELALSPGEWIAGIEHARYDSLGITLPTQRVVVPSGHTYSLVLSTPTARTIKRAYCGADAGDSTGVLVGSVKDARQATGLDAVTVVAQWMDVIVRPGGVDTEFPTLATRSQSDGWFVLCGIPGKADLKVWAMREKASTGVVALESPPFGLARVDLRLDPGATEVYLVSQDSLTDVALAATQTGGWPMPRTGSGRYTAVVRDEAGRPAAGAWARVIGHRAASSNAAGRITLDSLPLGTQSMEIRAIGVVPLLRSIDVSEGRSDDTLTLTSVKALLDTVRIAAAVFGGASEFNDRRRTGGGQYLTRDDVARAKPARFGDLLRRVGLSLQSQRYNSYVIQRGGETEACVVTVFVDGVFVPPEADLDFAVHPDEVEGVEYYDRSAKTPPQFRSPLANMTNSNCGTLIVWTRFRWKMPKPSP